MAFVRGDDANRLLVILNANDDQLDFPTIFASAKDGWAAEDPDVAQKDMSVLFNQIVAHVPAPQVDPDGPFQMLVTTMEADPFAAPPRPHALESRVSNVTIIDDLYATVAFFRHYNGTDSNHSSSFVAE